MSIFIEKIVHKKTIYAIIVRKNNQFTKKGVNFITRNQDLLQLGFIRHKKKHKIKPHYHLQNKRKISYFSEALIIKKGILKVKFYDIKNNNIANNDVKI